MWRESRKYCRGGGSACRVFILPSLKLPHVCLVPMELLKKWLGHPDELYNLMRFKMRGYKAAIPKMDQVSGASSEGSWGWSEGRGQANRASGFSPRSFPPALLQY